MEIVSLARKDRCDARHYGAVSFVTTGTRHVTVDRWTDCRQNSTNTGLSWTNITDAQQTTDTFTATSAENGRKTTKCATFFAQPPEGGANAADRMLDNPNRGRLSRFWSVALVELLESQNRQTHRRFGLLNSSIAVFAPGPVEQISPASLGEGRAH